MWFWILVLGFPALQALVVFGCALDAARKRDQFLHRELDVHRDESGRAIFIPPSELND